MPYQAGERLSGEYASRLGHLDVLKSPLVNALCKSFESRDDPGANASANSGWQPIPTGAAPLGIIFGVDGSLQILEDNKPPYKALAFVKTALLRMDQYALAKVDKDTPHPFALRDIMADSATYHATVFPLRNVGVPGKSNYHAIREVIYDSLRDVSLDGEPFETLKWIAYEKWNGERKSLPVFECPHCEREIATLPYDADTGTCPACGGSLFLTDMLGFHQIMGEDAAPNGVATDYMSIHETLLLFTGVRLYWEQNRRILADCLFVKDGPLSIRAQYSKLVAPIRRFLAHARDEGHPVRIVSQEKSGAFYDHLQLIGHNAPTESLFLPSDTYAKEKVQNRPVRGAAYGKDTNYGAKVFVKMNSYHQMVLNIPTGEFRPNPVYVDLCGADQVFATLRTVLSNRHEGAILPIELAHGVASLSTYPSASILRVFADKVMAKSSNQ